jgi:hypothetical protein
MAEPELTYALELRYTNYVKNAFILLIRAAFAHPFTPEQFRYHLTDASKRQLAIYRGWPKRQTKYPAILVETESGDFSISTVGQEEAYDIVDDNGLVKDVVYAGVMSIPVRLTVLTKTATDREKLTDLLSIYVRFVFREKFYKSNIPYLDISSGEDGEETVDGEVIYKGRVTVRCQTEFQQKIDQSLLDAVEIINIEPILYGSQTSDLQPNESD